MPGTQRQTPVERSTVRTPNGTPVASVDMNYRGVAGGLPTDDPDELERRANLYEEMGAFESAQAARMRAENLRGHNTLTQRSLSEIHPNILQKLAQFFGM